MGVEVDVLLDLLAEGLGRGGVAVRLGQVLDVVDAPLAALGNERDFDGAGIVFWPVFRRDDGERNNGLRALRSLHRHVHLKNKEAVPFLAVADGVALPGRGDARAGSFDVRVHQFDQRRMKVADLEIGPLAAFAPLP